MMAKREDKEQMEMTEGQDEPQEIGPEDVGELGPAAIPADAMLEMEASLKEEPVDVAVLRRDRVGPKVEAKAVVGQTFTIAYARQFPTAYSGQTHNPWFVVAVDENGERFNTILGGQAIHQELTAWAMLRTRAPLKVKLLFHDKKGRFEGYYTFE